MGLFGNIFNKLKGKKPENGGTPTSKIQALNVFSPNFSNEAKAEFNATFVAAVNAHANFISKIKPVVYLKDAPAENRTGLNKIISLKPNPLMNAAQFYKAIAKSYFQDNLVLIWPEFEINKLTGRRELKNLWPLDIDSVTTAVSNDGRTVLEFTVGGKKYYEFIENLIVLQREYDISQLFKGKNEALKFTLKSIQTAYEGIEQAIKMSQYIRFIIRSTTLLNEEALKARQKEFAERLLGQDGVLYVSGSEDIKEVSVWR